MEGRNQFTFYRSFYNAVLKQQEEHRLDFLMILIRYALDHKKPRVIPKEIASDFELVKPNLDTAWRKAMSGSEGGKISKRGPATKISKPSEKISKKEDKKKIEIKSKTETEGEGFSRFWARYPVQIGQAAARDAWECVIQEHDENLIMSRLEHWRRSKDWAREDGRFVPKPEKWLRECWFLKDPQQTVPMGATGELGQAELEAIQKLLREE